MNKNKNDQQFTSLFKLLFFGIIGIFTLNIEAEPARDSLGSKALYVHNAKQKTQQNPLNVIIAIELDDMSKYSSDKKTYENRFNELKKFSETMRTFQVDWKNPYFGNDANGDDFSSAGNSAFGTLLEISKNPLVEEALKDNKIWKQLTRLGSKAKLYKLAFDLALEPSLSASTAYDSPYPDGEQSMLAELSTYRLRRYPNLDALYSGLYEGAQNDPTLRRSLDNILGQRDFLGAKSTWSVEIFQDNNPDLISSKAIFDFLTNSNGSDLISDKLEKLLGETIAELKIPEKIQELLEKQNAIAKKFDDYIDSQNEALEQSKREQKLQAELYVVGSTLSFLTTVGHLVDPRMGAMLGQFEKSTQEIINAAQQYASVAANLGTGAATAAMTMNYVSICIDMAVFMYNLYTEAESTEQKKHRQIMEALFSIQEQLQELRRLIVTNFQQIHVSLFELSSQVEVGIQRLSSLSYENKARLQALQKESSQHRRLLNEIIFTNQTLYNFETRKDFKKNLRYLIGVNENTNSSYQKAEVELGFYVSEEVFFEAPRANNAPTLRFHTGSLLGEVMRENTEVDSIVRHNSFNLDNWMFSVDGLRELVFSAGDHLRVFEVKEILKQLKKQILGNFIHPVKEMFKSSALHEKLKQLQKKSQLESLKFINGVQGIANFFNKENLGIRFDLADPLEYHIKNGFTPLVPLEKFSASMEPFIKEMHEHLAKNYYTQDPKKNMFTINGLAPDIVKQLRPERNFVKFPFLDKKLRIYAQQLNNLDLRLRLLILSGDPRFSLHYFLNVRFKSHHYEYRQHSAGKKEGQNDYTNFNMVSTIYFYLKDSESGKRIPFAQSDFEFDGTPFEKDRKAALPGKSWQWGTINRPSHLELVKKWEDTAVSRELKPFQSQSLANSLYLDGRTTEASLLEVKGRLNKNIFVDKKEKNYQEFLKRPESLKTVYPEYYWIWQNTPESTLHLSHKDDFENVEEVTLEEHSKREVERLSNFEDKVYPSLGTFQYSSFKSRSVNKIFDEYMRVHPVESFWSKKVKQAHYTKYKTMAIKEALYRANIIRSGIERNSKLMLRLFLSKIFNSSKKEQETVTYTAIKSVQKNIILKGQARLKKKVYDSFHTVERTTESLDELKNVYQLASDVLRLFPTRLQVAPKKTEETSSEDETKKSVLNDEVNKKSLLLNFFPTPSSLKSSLLVTQSLDEAYSKLSEDKSEKFAEILDENFSIKDNPEPQFPSFLETYLKRINEVESMLDMRPVKEI